MANFLNVIANIYIGYATKWWPVPTLLGLSISDTSSQGGEGKYVMVYSKEQELTPETFMCIY